MNTLARNIKAIRKSLHKTQEEFAALLGANRGALAQWELGNNKPGADAMFQLCKISNKTKEELESVILTNATANTVSEGTPVYDIDVTAGNGLDFSSHLPETVKGYINLPNFKRCIAFIMVKGDSMYPKFKAGDLIGLEPVVDMDIIQWGQTYVVLTKDDQRLLKYVRKGKDEDHLILRSENDKYDDMLLHRNKVRKLFMAKGPVRDDWQ